MICSAALSSVFGRLVVHISYPQGADQTVSHAYQTSARNLRYWVVCVVVRFYLRLRESGGRFNAA
jgi:hypothetical protein